MIDLTGNELSFLRKLKKHIVPLALQGNLSLLHIDRLVPEYVIRMDASGDTAVFTLTEKGRQLLQAVDQVDQDGGDPAPLAPRSGRGNPGELPGFPDASKSRPKTHRNGGGLRARWKLPDGTILEWDSRHGTVEQYDRNGNHLGEFDYITGVQLAPGDSTRRVEP